MKRASGTLITTSVDRHGDRMMLSALESALERINETFVPVGVEHDPRIPPQGRILRASIRELEDGEYALEAEFEMFEPGDELSLDPNETRQLPIRSFPEGKFIVEFDRQLRADSDQQDIAAIGELFGSQPEEEIKKSLDPLAIVTIGGLFLLGGIANGFLSRLGEDAYEALKTRLKTLFRRRNTGSTETILRVLMVVRQEGREVEVELLASRPGDEAIDRLLGRELAVIDTLLPALLASDDNIKRLVFEYAAGSTSLKFAVRRDAVPTFPRGPSREDE